MWDSDPENFEELLHGRPEDHHWRTRPAMADEVRTWPAADEDAGPPGTTGPTPANELPPGAPEVFDVPEDRRGWFTQILTRAVAATALLFAGDSLTRHYATPRQRGDEQPQSGQLRLFELDPSWAESTATSQPVVDDLRAEGTLYRAPLPEGKPLEVFRGVESSLYGHLADGQVAAYLRAAPLIRRRWTRSRPRDGVVSLGRDGTVLTIRVTDRRR
ncbi:hypothetical protein ABZ793_23740 [Micromonospora sp. NPDC047465]|uniref:hypothetical protein n=1 Tax=Micromonospora sp. NPDC047465 TaxID=3154813 RepID=UPI0033CB13C5